jgi:hypothetical protein
MPGTAVARFFDAWGKKNHGLPLTEIMNLKKSQFFIVLSFIFLNNLKFVEHRESIFFI